MDLSDCANLKTIEGFDNDLTSVDFLNTLPNPKKLTYLDIRENNIKLTDLICFSRFINLETLNIGSLIGCLGPDERKRFEQGIYNRFHGSLKPLQGLKKLKKLSIANTDIDSGLEYLTENLEEIETKTNFFEIDRKDAKVENIHKALEPYGGDVEKWMDENIDLVRKVQGENLSEVELDKEESSEEIGEEDYIEEVGNDYTSAQEWLDTNYSTLETKSDCKEIRIGINEYNGDKGIEIKWGGPLRVEGFKNLGALVFPYSKVTSPHVDNCPNLTEINCGYNNLKELKITNCPKLAKLDFWGCGLTDFDFSSLNPESLVKLQIGNNNLSPRDVSCLASFTNLEWVRIGTTGGGGNKKNSPRNRFCGSLEAFKKMKNLSDLNIANTDIDQGLEYLPKSLDKGWFNCQSNNHNYFKVTRLKRILEAYGGKVKKWKVANSSDALEDLQEELEEKEELSPNEAEKWIIISSKLGDVNFATFLREKGLKISEILSYNDREIEEWRKEYISSLTFSDDEEDEFGSRFRMLRLEEDSQTYELDDLQGSQREAANEAVIEIRKKF